MLGVSKLGIERSSEALRAALWEFVRSEAEQEIELTYTNWRCTRCGRSGRVPCSRDDVVREVRRAHTRKSQGSCRFSEDLIRLKLIHITAAVSREEVYGGPIAGKFSVCRESINTVFA